MPSTTTDHCRASGWNFRSSIGISFTCVAKVTRLRAKTRTLLDTAEMNYDRIRKNPTSFLSLTGVKVNLFDQILPFSKAAHDEYFHWYDVKGKKMTRRRSHCIQFNSPLATIEERLFFILTFLKNNPTQEYHAAGFDMSQQRCGQWIHTPTTVLRNATDMAGMLPAETLAEFKKILEERGGEKVLHACSSMIPRRGRFPGRAIRKFKRTFTAEKRRSIQSKMQ